jgi:hypothetical protein
MEQVLMLSNKQIARLAHGKTVPLKRAGNRFVLTRKNNKEHRIIAKMKLLELQLEKLRNSFTCGKCDRTFGSKAAVSTHRVRAHGKNWTTRKK